MEPRRSKRLEAKQTEEQQPRQPRNTPRDPEYDSVPVAPDVWAYGTSHSQDGAGTVRFRARYADASREESVEFECWRDRASKKWWPVSPTYQGGYARLQFKVARDVGTNRCEERRNRVFAHMVHGAPPGDAAQYHADHTTKFPDGTWARSTGPVAWLTTDEHGRKHGQEGAAEAKRRRTAAQADEA
jgi:hypothetical protein